MLTDYYSTEVVPCRKCGEASMPCSTHLTYEKLPPYWGGPGARVLIIGHSPKVRTGSEIDITLDLNRARRLRRYIAGEVLAPLGLGLERCAATNLVKCLTDAMPEDLRGGRAHFMDEVAAVCGAHLRQEVASFDCRLVISLSERVSDILQDLFMRGAPRKPMKEIFGTRQVLTIGGRDYPWVPVVHIPFGKVRAHYFPEQTYRLRRLSSEVIGYL